MAFPKTKTAYYTRCRPEKTVVNRQKAVSRKRSHGLRPTGFGLLPSGVVVFDFGDRGKRYLDDLAIGAFYLHAWSGECLSGFHAPDNAPHALAVKRYDLNIVFAV